MNIYFPHSKQLDYENYYRVIRNSKVFSKHTCFLPHEKSKIPINSKSIIKTCDLVIAEVSFPGTGLGIELGWADSFNKRIVCIYKDGSSVAGSLKIISKDIIVYKDCNDLIQKLEAYL